jgi:hypothetical protein
MFYYSIPGFKSGVAVWMFFGKLKKAFPGDNMHAVYIISICDVVKKKCNACASATGKDSSNNLKILRFPQHTHPVSCMRLVSPKMFLTLRIKYRTNDYKDP